MLYENGEFERIRPHLTPLECGIIFDGIPEGAISRKVGLIWGIPAHSEQTCGASPCALDEVDIATFANGNVNDCSVTADVFANMADATSTASAAWNRILTLAQVIVDQMEDVCAQIEAAQPVP